MSSKKYEIGTSENLAELEKPARTDSVGATLILLDLLEGEIEGLAKLSLGHPEQRTPQAHASADMNVDRPRSGTTAPRGARSFHN